MTDKPSISCSGVAELGAGAHAPVDVGLVGLSPACLAAPGRRAVLALALATALSGCNFIERQFQGEQSSYAGVRAAIKSALIRSDDVDAAPVSVRERDGAIVLTGYVPDASQAAAAERLASENAGGWDVINELEVR